MNLGAVCGILFEKERDNKVKSVIFDGLEIFYVHTRSDSRSISATVDKDGILQVRSPRRVGDEVIRRFILDNGSRILGMLDRNRQRAKYEEALGDRGIERLRELARSVIPERVEHFAKIIGVRPSRVRINAATTRFGSCSSKGNLNFSCRVMAYSANAVDYVVVHELCHLIHMNHSPEFWRTVEKYMPDYRAARQELRRIPGISE